jgi:hypothetical protein
MQPMKELKELLNRIAARAYTKQELLGIKRDLEWRIQCGLGKQKAKLARQALQYCRGI